MKKSLALVTCLITSVGCSTIDPAAAQKLSNKGGQVSSAIGNSYATTRNSLEHYIEGEYLLSGLKAGYSEPSAPMLASISTVERALSLRLKMFDDLSTVYASFGSLIAYDASSEFSGAIGQLNGAITAYGKVVDHSFAGISQPASDIITKTSGILAEQEKLRRVQKSSELIRSRLEEMVRLMMRESESNAINATNTEIARGKVKVSKALWDQGIASADSILADNLASYGLLLAKSDSNSSADVSPELKTAIAKVLERRGNQEQAAIKGSYNASVEALKALIVQHKKLEKGESISLTEIETILVKIQEYLVLLRKLQATSKG